MSFDIKEQNGAMLAAVLGRLDTPSAVKAQQEIEPLLENADKEIILDCEQLQYISSSGLRLFLTIRKAAAAQGGEVVVKGIRNDIRTVFMMTGFLNLFKIEE